MKPRTFVDNLKTACSDIDEQWQEHLDFWEDEEPGYYNDISVIVHYIISKYKESNLEDFQRIAEVIELGLQSNNAETSELALVGVLEGILFVGSHDDIRSESHKNWLGKLAYQEILGLEEAFEKLHNKPINRTKKAWLSSCLARLAKLF
ncbi:MAG: hypothetical protein V2I33_00260 [Kangiellaceae bacterium]|jgi:hypothetical protein|nr:hypothetical protein [Kangiellaceae bacterium]